MANSPVPIQLGFFFGLADLLGAATGASSLGVVSCLAMGGLTGTSTSSSAASATVC